MSPYSKALISVFILAISYLLPFLIHPSVQSVVAKNISNPWMNVLQSTQVSDGTDKSSLNSLSVPALLSLGQKIKLNQAQVKDLEYLPGIGEKTAQKIIAERERLGSFKKLEDLMKIKGIKEKKFAKIKSQLEL